MVLYKLKFTYFMPYHKQNKFISTFSFYEACLKKMWGGNLEHRLRKTKMRYFGHLKCRDENSILRRAMELEVESRRPVGRPKKTWSTVVEKT